MTNWASPSGERQPEQPAHHGPPPPTPQYGQYAPGRGPQPDHSQSPRYGQQYPPPQTGPYGGPPSPQAPRYGPAPGLFAPKPGVIPLRPLVLGDILEGAFRTVRGNPMATLGMSLVISTLFAIPTLLLTLLITNTAFGADNTGDALVSIANSVGQLVGVFASILLSGMLIVVVAEAVLGHRASIGEAWTRVKPRIWSLLGATLLLMLGGILIVAVLVGVTLLAYLAGGEIAAVIVGILAVVGGLALLIWLGTRTMLSPAAVTLEGIGPVRSLKRSWELTRGQFWRIFGISLVTQLLVGMIASMILFPAMLVGMGVLLAGADPDAGVATPLWFVVFMQVMTIISTAITAPFSSSVTGLLYIDQRIRREALDLELMKAAGQK